MSTLTLGEPERWTEDPFWVIQVVVLAPLALLGLMGLDGMRYAIMGPSTFERSVEIDVLYAASFRQLAAWAVTALLTLLLWLAGTHATRRPKRRLWTIELVLVPVLLALAHWHASAVLNLAR